MTVVPKKPKPAASTSTWVRARQVVASHPKISWGTLAAIVTVFGIIGPWVYSGWKSWDERYVKTDAYVIEIAALRAEAKAEYAKIRSESQSKFDAILRKLAFSAAADARRDTVVLRNRVNDCNVRIQQRTPPMVPFEIAACEQYKDELRAATAHYEDLQREAMLLTRP